ncbi:MAG: signal peptidase I [Actinomycetota bacterium]|nr:signal peptidase I [Actinomycetota bacterium]
MNIRRGAWLALPVGLLVGLAVAIRRLGFEIAEHSMVPVLQPGDYVIALPLRRPPRRGELVVFEHPHRPGFFLVKRVVGLPSETVEIRSGFVLVEDGRLAEPWAGRPTPGEGRWALAGDRVFVLGDRRAHSAADGRDLGPLPLGSLRRVAFRYWPPARIGWPSRLPQR